MDFLHTLTVISSSVTWTLANSNLQLTWSSFCFPSDYFYIILPLMTRTMLKVCHKSGKKMVYHCTEIRSTQFIAKQPCQFFVVTFFVTPFQSQCPSLWSVHDIEDITWQRRDTNFIFECWKTYFQHKKIKFVSPIGHVMFCLFYRCWRNSYIKHNFFWFIFETAK